MIYWLDSFSQKPLPVIKEVNKFVELIGLEDLKFFNNGFLVVLHLSDWIVTMQWEGWMNLQSKFPHLEAFNGDGEVFRLLTHKFSFLILIIFSNREGRLQR